MAKVVGKLAVEIFAEDVRPALIVAMGLTICDLERWHDIIYEAGYYNEASILEEEYLAPLREFEENI